MTEIKKLNLALKVLHTLGAVFALVVFAITAATIAEANRAKAAVASLTSTLNNGNGDFTGDLTGLLSAWNFDAVGGARKLLMSSRGLLGSTAPEGGAFFIIGFSAFLNFTMFVSISGLLLSGFLALCYLSPTFKSIRDKTLGAKFANSPAWAKWPFFELLFACVWCIFWLAAAGAASDSPLAQIAGYCKGISACDQVNAVVALSWLSWLIWLTVVVLLAVEYGMAAAKSRRTHTENAAATASANNKDAGAAAPPAVTAAASKDADAKPVQHVEVIEVKEEVPAAKPPAWGSIATEEAGQGPAAAEVELPSAVPSAVPGEAV